MLNIETGSIWKHLKTGHVYTVVGDCIIEATMTDAILYRLRDDIHAPVWCRPRSEFTDGRFQIQGD